MSKLSDAIHTIVETLPYLKTEGDGAIPVGQRAAVEGIRRTAAQHTGGMRDVQIVAAEEWATKLIEDAIAADKAEAKPVEKEATIIGGSVVVRDKPLSDAELEALTAPEKEGK